MSDRHRGSPLFDFRHQGDRIVFARGKRVEIVSIAGDSESTIEAQADIRGSSFVWAVSCGLQPTEKRFITAGNDGLVHLWNAEDRLNDQVLRLGDWQAVRRPPSPPTASPVPLVVRRGKSWVGMWTSEDSARRSPPLLGWASLVREQTLTGREVPCRAFSPVPGRAARWVCAVAGNPTSFQSTGSP